VNNLKSMILSATLILSLTACAPETPPPEPSPTVAWNVLGTLQVSTPTAPGFPSTPAEIASCDNAYMPSDEGATWTFAGSNSSTGTYTRTDTITASEGDSYTIATQLTKVSYAQEFSCTAAGLVNMEPNQSDIAAMFHGPSGNVTVHRVSNSGVTLPVDIQAGDSREQVFAWDATGPDASGYGTFTYAFTAAGIETVSVPAGTFDALRIDAVIQMEIGATPKLTGTYTTTVWLAEDIGLVKSEGSSQIPGVEFTDRLELVSFDVPQG